MKTRAQIYAKEAAGLLRAVSLYPGLTEEQLCRFYPRKEEAMHSVLAHLKKQGRIEETEDGGWFVYGAAGKSDGSVRRTAWVLLDFIERAEFHASADFPVCIIFFAEGEVYEIIDIPAGQEVLITQALRRSPEEPGRRIVIVDSPAQIAELDIPGAAVFCTVDAQGNVTYYRKEGEV